MLHRRFLLFVMLIPITVQAEVGFVQSTIETGVSVQQTVAYGYFRDENKADLVVARITEDQKRNVGIYELSSDLTYGSEALVEFELPEDVVAIDVGRLGKRDVLVLITADRAIEYDPFADTVRSLVSFSSLFNVPVIDEIPKLDFMRDLNDDGLDDFAIPGFKGYTVFLQQSDGHFSAPLHLHAPAVMELTYNNHPWYTARMMFLTDLTLDGKPDIVFWIDDRFTVYEQLGDGSFAVEPTTFEPNVPFEYDGVEGVSFRMGEEDQSDLTARALHQLKDLTGDGITDLSTLTYISKGVFNKTTTFEIYPGSNVEGRLQFSTEPVSRIESKGIQYEMQDKDLNGDGQMDMVVSSVQIGIAKIIGALLTGNVNIDLDFYQMVDGVYPREPNANREITASFDLSSGDVFFPFVLIADVNGDPYADLLVQEGVDTLRIYEGEEGDRLFGRKSIELKLPLANAEFVELVDLNNDDQQDIVMRLEKKNEANRVTVLIADHVRAAD